MIKRAEQLITLALAASNALLFMLLCKEHELLAVPMWFGAVCWFSLYEHERQEP